jgi:hypothetical protein
MYLRNELKYKTDFTYNMFGPVRPWDNSNDNTGELASGDGSVLAFMVNLDIMMVLVIILMPSTICGKWIPSGKLKDKMSWKGYRSG